MLMYPHIIVVHTSGHMLMCPHTIT